MNLFINKILKTCLKYRKILDNIIHPLRKNFNVSFFYYLKITNQGNYTCFGNQLDWAEHYFKEKFYLQDAHCLKPCNYQKGPILNLLTETETNLIETVARTQFDTNFLLEVGSRNNEGVEFYGMAVPTNKKNNLSFYLNSLSLFNFFIKKVQKDYSFIFHDLEESSVNFAKEIGPSFYIPDNALIQSRIEPANFMQDIGIKLPQKFSKREREVAKLLIKSQTASQMGKNLHLSKRTIEMYIESLKQKLNCQSKSSLIDHCQDLESINYWCI